MSDSLQSLRLPPQEIEHARRAVTEARRLEPGGSLEPETLQWANATTIGLDTEFVRERTFFPRPGLIQLSDGHTVWLLDALAPRPITQLGELLERPSQVKILHAAGEDLEVFQILTGALPRPLFDTQIAAAMLGQPLQLRYEHLVFACFGVELPGGKARSDWCKRPLDDSLLEYAAQDVIWLPRLHAHLADGLAAKNRLQWLDEDCERLVASASSNLDTSQTLDRVKGAGRLDDTALAWLSVLVRWRDHQARERDLPRSFVLRDEAMLDTAVRLVRQGPTPAALEGMPKGLQSRHGERLLALLESGPPTDFRRPAELMQLDQDQRDWLKLAQQHVRTQAEALEIDPALIASKRELTRLARGEHPDWLQGWRGSVLADLPKPA